MNEYLNLDEMTSVIKNFLEKKGYVYKQIQSVSDIQILYNLIKDEKKNRLHKLNNNVKYIAGLFFDSIHDTKSMMEMYLDAAKQGCSECLNLLGRYYYQRNDHGQMMEFWKLAIEKNNVEAMINIATFFEEQGQFENMVQSLKIPIDLGCEKAFHLLAKYYRKYRNVDKMIEIYRKGIHNGFTGCMVELGKYYLSQGDFENAIKYFTSGSKTNPEAMYHLGMIYESRKNYDEMVDLYNQAIQQNHTLSMVRLGDYYKKIKKYDLMVHTYKLASQTNSDAMNKLGLYYQKKKQYNEMIKYYESAIKLGCVNAMNNLAIYYESIGQDDKMLFLLGKAIEKNSSVAMYNMGLYYEKNKNYDKMTEYFMMSYQNGRIFDHSEIRLMKKSILKIQKPSLSGFVKLLDDKKNQLKAIFEKKNQKPKDPKKKIKRNESKFKISKEPETKEEMLIDMPVETKSNFSLFSNMDLYKAYSSKIPDSTIESDRKVESSDKKVFNPNIPHIQGDIQGHIQVEPSKYDLDIFPKQYHQDVAHESSRYDFQMFPQQVNYQTNLSGYPQKYPIPMQTNHQNQTSGQVHSNQMHSNQMDTNPSSTSKQQNTFGNLNSNDLNMYKLFLQLSK